MSNPHFPAANEMTCRSFAAHLGVSPAAVSKVIRAGSLADAVRIAPRGPIIADVPRAVELWLSRPGSRAPALSQSDTSGRARARKGGGKGQKRVRDDCSLT